jgi:hypothetical protein
MTTVLLLLAGDADEMVDGLSSGPELSAGQSRSWIGRRAADDPMAHTAYGSRWPFDVVANLELPSTPGDDGGVATVVDRLGDSVDRARSTVIVGTTHPIIEGRTDVALVYVIHRVASLSVAEYQHHWRDVHGPLAKELVPTRGYEQAHADPQATAELAAALGLRDEGLDGAATCFFDTRDDFAAMLAARESSLDMNRIYEDELRFIDHGRSLGALVRRIGGPSA